jgi:LPS-assembly protein
MTWSSAFPKSPRLLPLAAAVIAALSVPGLARAQVPNGLPIVNSVPDISIVTGIQGGIPPAPENRKRKSEKNCPQTAEAETMLGSLDRVMYMINDVEVSQCETDVVADKATYHVVEDQIDAFGQVRMTRYGDLYAGDELILRMDTGLGYMINPDYHLASNNAQGQAKRIDFEGDDRAKVIQGTYSTCEGPDPDWYLKSATMDLDQNTETGNAHNATLYFDGVPILFAPQMPFPLSGDRKSGFLAPSEGGSNRGGLEIETPYYFNIAPNRDLTVYPTWIQERGLQLGADVRYLEPNYFGETRFEYLAHDDMLNTKRWAITSVQSQVLAPGWSLSWNISGASDDDYPNDFTRSITTASQRLLWRDFSLTYAQPFWSAQLNVTGFQVLQDPLAPIVPPYDQLPQFLLHAGKLDDNGFDWSVDFSAIRFWQPGPGVTEGDRYTLTPRLSYPIIAPYGFITPKVTLNLTEYQLQDQSTGVPSSIYRGIPTFSLDSGLIFERDTEFNGHDLTQTLEPRLFYLRTPYHQQNFIPNFDSADVTPNFTQLFAENRFVGGDRIGDANQLTAAVTTRFIDPTGEERARFGIGQRFSFIDQRVTLPNDLPNANSNSDLLLTASGKFSGVLTANADLDYSESTHGLTEADVGMRLQPEPKKLLNVQYIRDVPNAIQQISTSGQWPILSRWYAVGRVDYSLLTHDVTQGLVGIEYKADCWVLRFGAQHSQTATDVSSTSSFIQLELNGLGSLGQNAVESMRLNVPGYQAVNQAPRPINQY